MFGHHSAQFYYFCFDGVGHRLFLLWSGWLRHEIAKIFVFLEDMNPDTIPRLFWSYLFSTQNTFCLLHHSFGCGRGVHRYFLKAARIILLIQVGWASKSFILPRPRTISKRNWNLLSCSAESRPISFPHILQKDTSTITVCSVFFFITVPLMIMGGGSLIFYINTFFIISFPLTFEMLF